MPKVFIRGTAGARDAGYGWLIACFELRVLQPRHLTYIGRQGGRKEISDDDGLAVVLPPAYAPADTAIAHLEFAMKHEGLHLEVLSALFLGPSGRRCGADIVALMQSKPTGSHARRLWFVYEFLTQEKLPLADLSRGNYLRLVDGRKFVTGVERRSRRHRVINNILGTIAFSPMVRRTQKIAKYQALDLADHARQLLSGFDEDVLRRATHYLYIKETRSSFSLENELPNPGRLQRFLHLLEHVPPTTVMSEESLTLLQNKVVTDSFSDASYRKDQVYIGESVTPIKQVIHYIAPKPQDVPALMRGLIEVLDSWDNTDMDPIVQAALFSFGFVFIHPFSDGNGRLHRLFIHYLLTWRGFHRSDVILPVSATMLAHRADYDRALESFSVPLMACVDYEEAPDGSLIVLNDTAAMYKFFDATPIVDYFYFCIKMTLEEQFVEELHFLVRWRKIRAEVDRSVEMPDRLADLFIKLCWQNRGQLAKKRRTSLFAQLTDKQITVLEAVVQKHM